MLKACTKRSLTILLLLMGSYQLGPAQKDQPVAQGGPGNDAAWPSAAKDGFGTSLTLQSKVWFTLSRGILTEVYYPTLDMPNVQMLQLVIVDGSSVETEADNTFHRTEILDEDSLSFRQTNTAKSGKYKITKTYATDPHNNSLIINIDFESRTSTRVYVYLDPSLGNSGMHDTAWIADGVLFAVDGRIVSALATSGTKPSIAKFGASASSNGFLGVNDGLTELRKTKGQSFVSYSRAENGNVVQFAELTSLSNRKTARCTLALSFGQSAHEALQNATVSLRKGFATVQNEYQRGWRTFTRWLPRVTRTDQREFNVAAMTLRALEDKTYRGATIASPSIPWGGGLNGNEATISGYHAVWSRDLYHIATALKAIGDLTGANRALDFLMEHQQKSDGSFPQNSRVTGEPIGNGVQMDQIALPIVLAYQLRRTNGQAWLEHIKPAADFIVRVGPVTGQDRWEEKSGYSPATIAAEIAGLVCGAYIARLNGDRISESTYLKTADDWARNVERWTATSAGSYRSGSYYLRITEKGDPNVAAPIEINSGGGSYDQREIVDAGFLELVRLGIKPVDDPLIISSVRVVDDLIKKDTPKGTAWYRYNHDAYGEQPNGEPYDGRHGIGRLWTLLSGERGEFELARGRKSSAVRLLRAMRNFANEGLMVPEQVWDRVGPVGSQINSGEGSGSATPLAWSMAQFIRLAINIKYGRNLETPAIVRARYLGRGRSLEPKNRQQASK